MHSALYLNEPKMPDLEKLDIDQNLAMNVCGSKQTEWALLIVLVPKMDEKHPASLLTVGNSTV